MLAQKILHSLWCPFETLQYEDENTVSCISRHPSVALIHSTRVIIMSSHSFYWGWARFYFSEAVNYGQWVPVSDHSWTHHYMLPSAVSKARMHPSGHDFCSASHYCEWQNNLDGKSVPDTKSLACDCQKRCSNPHKLIFCRSVLLIKSTIVVASIPIVCSVSKTQIQHGVQNDPGALCLK